MRLLLITLLSLPVLLAADDKDPMPEGEGKAVTVRLCSTCHGPELMLGKQLSEEGWTAVVMNMAQRGVNGTEDEFYDIVQYLTKYMKGTAPAKINVNKASAKTIEVGLSLSARDAEAIVKAREKTGFKTLEDVKKVPGVDVAKIEARKDRVAF